MTIVCFEAHAADGKVWAVRHRGKWYRTAHVSVDTPFITRYRGPKARQPKAYIQCCGPAVIARSKDAIAIRNARTAADA